jgi:c-di-GMP-binding flagellar brake protein YcgR
MKLKVREKRKFKRGPLQIPVYYTFQKKPEIGYMSNLSEGGCLMYCHSPAPVKINKTVEISFNLKNYPEPITLKARVVRSAPFVINAEDVNCLVGLQFLSLTPSQKEAINNYVRKALQALKQK